MKVDDHIMDCSRSESVFNRLLCYSVKFGKEGIITREAEMVSEFNIFELNNFFDELMNEIIKLDQKHKIDSKYYTTLFYIEHDELKEKYIFKNDPFWPLYKHLKKLFEDLKLLNDLYSEKKLNIEPDTFIKSILLEIKIFLYDLSSSICNDYTFKKSEMNQRLNFKRQIKNKIDDIIFKQTKNLYEKLPSFLNKTQRQFDEFKMVSEAFKTLKKNYNDFCPPQKEKNVKTLINNEKSDYSIFADSNLWFNNFNVKEKNNQYFSIDNKTESILSTNSTNNVSEDKHSHSLEDITSHSCILHLYIPLVFISMCFIILTKKLLK